MRDDLLGHAAVVAARNAGRAERERRLCGETVQALVDAGFARHFVPRRWGGEEGGFGELVARSAVLAERGCPCAAWCGALLAAHGRIASFLPERGRAQVWAHGPDARIAAALAPPAGTALPVAGGLVLSGRWTCASGVDFADWVLLAAWEGRGAERRARVLAVPAGDLGVLDTWDSPGMRGTGSNSVLAESVHVPYHRTFLLADLTAGRPGAGLPRCHGAPAHLAGGLMFAAPALGAATRALHLWTHRTSTGTGSTGSGSTGTHGTVAAGTPAAASGIAGAHGTGSTAAAAHGTAGTAGAHGTGTAGTAGAPAAGTGIAGTPAVGVGTAVAGRGVAAGTADTLTRSSGEVEAARLLLTEAARRADTEPVTERLVARNRRDAVLAVTLLATAVRRLADTTGPHEDEQDTTLLRLCRDVTTVASHGALRMEPAAEAYAAAVLRPAAP
ncbi:oxidoreductase [Kitasatospora indigofera]|uniref:oxidoreductase n=1 Tax=Kitasatospora indigofera TaxID=67307 RepID=UPI00367A4CB3